MERTIKNVALVVSALILFSFVLFVINQTAQVVELASHLSPTAGVVRIFCVI